MAIRPLISTRMRAGPIWIAFLLVLTVAACAMQVWIGHSFHSTTDRIQSRTDAGHGSTSDRPLPKVEPLEFDASDPDEARRRNGLVPFSTAPNPPARAFHFIGDAKARDRATDCLAAAMIYEAGDTAGGERAVGQVVLNRVRHPAFPKTVCGVVFQGSERASGCQFTFTCDGAMDRSPSNAAWERARELAAGMLAGDVYKPVGMSTHYHTDWVLPYWSSSLDKVASVDSHLFFRWQGWWGTPAAFRNDIAIPAEPAIRKLVFLSPSHDDKAGTPTTSGLAASLIDDTAAASPVTTEWIGRRIGPGKLLAVEEGGNAFAMALDLDADPTTFSDAARRLCTGRPRCRLLAWTDRSKAASSFPVPESALPTMSFSYLRNKDSKIERILYNCDEFPRIPRVQCMVRRLPSQSGGVRLLADDKAAKAELRASDEQKPAVDRIDPPRLIDAKAIVPGTPGA